MHTSPKSYGIVKARTTQREEVRERDYRSKEHALVSLLKTCAKRKDLSRGIKLHGEIVESKLFEKSPHIATTLITMYAKCGMIGKARQVLEGLSTRNVVTWSALISGYANLGEGLQALECYERMLNEGISPNALTSTCMLKACANLRDSKKGRRIHGEISAAGMSSSQDVLLGTSLIDMYAKCGEFGHAERVLDEISIRNSASWSALMSGYTRYRQDLKALNALECMRFEGLSPDAITYTCILKACSNTAALGKGREIHGEILSRGLLKDNAILGTALVDMYARCEMLTKAEDVLIGLGPRDTVAWSALIAGYAQQGRGDEALRCLEHMRSEGLVPNVVTFVGMLKACGIDEGKRIHDEIVGSGVSVAANAALANALLDMYARCGHLSRACALLEELPCRDVVSWNALIGGYAKHGLCDDALTCLRRMVGEGTSPNSITFIGILKACCGAGALRAGEAMHGEIVRMGLQRDAVVGTALAEMYAKCGALARSRQVLEGLPDRDVVSWSALISGYAKEGRIVEAARCLERMANQGLAPSEVTFLCILSACGHSGHLDKAQTLLESMARDYGLVPSWEHQACMVAIYGHAGRFDDAMSAVEAIPSSEHRNVWLVVLGACRKWGNAKLGIAAFDQALQRHGSSCPAAYHTLAASIFADAGMHEDARRVLSMRLKCTCLLVQ